MKLQTRLIVSAAISVALATVGPTQSGASEAGSSSSATTARPDAARDYFTDVELINQDGVELRLYTDLMKDRVVIINAIFTDCQGVCPVTMGHLVKIQKWLGPRLGNEVLLLSLTVDRETDSPARLKEYAETFQAQPGWHFLTGEPHNLDFALRKLGLWVDDKESHSPVFLVGNVTTGLWKKAQGMAAVGSLIEIVDSVLDDRLETDPDEAARGRR